MINKILNNQKILNLAIQHTDSEENVFVLAVQNGKSLTDDLEAGNSLLLSADSSQHFKDILEYDMAIKRQPATAISSQQSVDSRPEDIDYCIISNDFTVS